MQGGAKVYKEYHFIFRCCEDIQEISGQVEACKGADMAHLRWFGGRVLW